MGADGHRRVGQNETAVFFIPASSVKPVSRLVLPFNVYKDQCEFLEQSAARLFFLTMASDFQVPNVYAYLSRQLLSAYHDQQKNMPHVELSTVTSRLQNPAPSDDLPVCIIGTGTAGLYTAMIFESLNISYRLVEANTRERVGGRVFTYHFPNSGPYDYFVCNLHLASCQILISA